MADAERSGVDTDVSNTYVGFNYFVAPFSGNPRHHQAHKIVFNYILGDDADWNGLGGYSDDGYVMQWQYKF